MKPTYEELVAMLGITTGFLIAADKTLEGIEIEISIKGPCTTNIINTYRSDEVIPMAQDLLVRARKEDP